MTCYAAWISGGVSCSNLDCETAIASALQKDEKRKTRTAHLKNITGLALSRDGRILVSADASGEVRTWDTDDLVEIAPPVMLDLVIEWLVLSQEGESIFVGGRAPDSLIGKLWFISFGSGMQPLIA